MKNARSMYRSGGVICALVLLFSACSNGSSSGSDSDVSESLISVENERIYIGPKAPTEEKEVGDIVFNDGSAIPYTTYLDLDDATKNSMKAKVIALIFYNGTGLNSGNDTTTSRTLGLGIVHKGSGCEWSYFTDDAYNINITTIQCEPSGNAGALTFTGDKNGSDNFEQIGAFSGVNDTSSGDYSVFHIAKNYKHFQISFPIELSSHIISGSEFENNWYVPTVAELFQIYKNGKSPSKIFNIDEALSAVGSTELYESYWSSTQCASQANCAYIFFFEDIEDTVSTESYSYESGNCYPFTKHAQPPICFIRAF